MGKFCQLLTELSVRDTSIFSFRDTDLIFTQLDMCIDIVEMFFSDFYSVHLILLSYLAMTRC